MRALIHERWSLLAAMVASGLATGGCSFAFVDGAPGRGGLEACTETYAAPIADISIAGGLIQTELAMRSGGGPAGQEDYVSLNLPIAAMALISGIYGFATVTECRDAVRRVDAEEAEPHLDAPSPPYEPSRGGASPRPPVPRSMSAEAKAHIARRLMQQVGRPTLVTYDDGTRLSGPLRSTAGLYYFEADEGVRPIDLGRVASVEPGNATPDG